MSIPNLRLLMLPYGLFLAGVGTASAQPAYRVRDLGTLGGNIAVPAAITNNGYVVGWSEFGTWALRGLDELAECVNLLTHAGVQKQYSHQP